MAVAFDTVGNAATANSLATLAATLTIANSPDRFAILTLGVRPDSGTASSVTIGGLSFSLVSTVNYSTSLGQQVYVCYNPGIGTQTAVVVMAHSTSFIFACSVFNGVDQASGYSIQYTASGSAAAATATISTSTTDLVFASLHVGGSQGDGSVSYTGSTQRVTVTTGTRRTEHHTYAPAGTTQTIAFAGVAATARMLHGINIKAASATPSVLASLSYTLPQLGVGQ